MDIAHSPLLCHIVCSLAFVVKYPAMSIADTTRTLQECGRPRARARRFSQMLEYGACTTWMPTALPGIASTLNGIANLHHPIRLNRCFHCHRRRAADAATVSPPFQADRASLSILYRRLSKRHPPSHWFHLIRLQTQTNRSMKYEYACKRCWISHWLNHLNEHQMHSVCRMHTHSRIMISFCQSKMTTDQVVSIVQVLELRILWDTKPSAMLLCCVL